MEQIDPDIPEKQTNELEPEKDLDAEVSLHIPDGGWGWVVCFAGFMTNFTIYGLLSSNGILVLGLAAIYDVSISKTAMVGSIFSGTMLCVGPFVLLLMMFNASHRQVIICGGFISAVATFTSFFVEQVEVIYVTYGILSGIFSGMSYFSCNTIVGSYFKKKRTLAVGISQSGTGIGAIVLNYFLERSISFYACDNVLIYLPAKVVSVGLTREEGALIMAIYGAIIGPSQIVVGILGDVFHIPVSYLLMPSLFGMSATTLAFTFCNSFSLFVLCVSLFAIFYGSLFDATQSYDSAFYFTTGSLFIACIISSGIIYLQRKEKFHEK
ncbi:unnamed protein product [Acanthosepion pharaonis]|uniref:Uncharacterized protein n=1 Tax=Acanthosepion pharaonis TaxID=158019 RepID=A0A812CWH9_ACAPH|nr:unnamed protein product [Sepia pharaonis]